MASIKAEFMIPVTAEDIAAIMDTASTSAKHWCSDVIKLTPDEVVFHNKIDDRAHSLTQDGLIAGLKRYIQKPVAKSILKPVDPIKAGLKSADYVFRINPRAIDGPTADAIIQYSLFGDILYVKGIKLELDEGSIKYLEKHVELTGWLMKEICKYAAGYGNKPEVCAWYADLEDFISDWESVGYTRKQAKKLLKDNPNEFMYLPSERGIIRFAI